jgi:hypothetical protein
VNTTSRLPSLTAGLLTAALLMAGCATVTGQPSAATGGPPPVGVDGVDLCELLTDAQLAELRIPPVTSRAAGEGPFRTCTWTAGDGRPAAQLILAAGTLDELAATQAGGPAVEPDEVAGYPAYRSDNAGGGCGLFVGVTDEYVLTVSGLAAPCATTRELAGLAVSNLRSA